MDDVIIIGGGPAGSGLGCYLSKAGISNIIIEGANHPRPHVGESLVLSTLGVFQEIGFLETMEQENFVRKYGAAWHPITKQGDMSLKFANFTGNGINQDYTYHVDRARFDMLLLKQAEKLGSKVYQGIHVKEVLFDDNGQANGVMFRVGDQEVRLSGKVIVDATGRNTLLGRQLKIKKNDPIFNQYAVHTWYKGVQRNNGADGDYIHIYFLPVERGWTWQIPITDEITSIGVVTEKEVFKQSKLDVEEYFNSHLQSTPALAEAMQNATRIKDFEFEGDYSYSMDKFVGDGFLLIGDAARFVDPIFSSGVSVALYSAKFASEVICQAFEANDFSVKSFTPYETRLRKGVQIWYEFIRLYYKMLPLFTHFIRTEEYRRDVLRLLQGEVFDRDEVPVLDKMKNYVKTVEASDNHLFKKHLTNIPID